MSKPKYRWWGFARQMIRDYPELRSAWRELHTQSLVADISGMPKGESSGRTVEGIALRQLPIEDQKAYDAVKKAMESTACMKNGAERIRLIELMYLGKKKLPVKDAALLVHVSEITAKRWHGDFVRLVGKCYGFKDDTPEPK